ncbi:hypothetical protein DUNSADRAFT_2248 [Dunaliella salina]|nr:hypothetical protein DUNSADRAFT_2248 [Dunaliella salina]|eukprot:KAF5838786.1 hypothetical protein DUNSADRAFT_2248 [Dunaliella salina]
MLVSGLRLPALSRPFVRHNHRAVAPVTRAMASNGKMTLIDVPVSNNGARARWVKYKKGLEDVEIQPPKILGGLKTPEYLAKNPQGKMPLLLLPDGGAIPESEVIVQYLVDKFSSQGPSLSAATPEARAVGNTVTRFVDVYITPIQACMYRKMDSAEERAKQIGQIAAQMDAIEFAIKDTASPFITGSEMTTADGALFPTIVFMQYILPKFFGWKDIFANRPKLAVWAVNNEVKVRITLQSALPQAAAAGAAAAAAAGAAEAAACATGAAVAAASAAAAAAAAGAAGAVGAAAAAVAAGAAGAVRAAAAAAAAGAAWTVEAAAAGAEWTVGAAAAAAAAAAGGGVVDGGGGGGGGVGDVTAAAMATVSGVARGGGGGGGGVAAAAAGAAAAGAAAATAAAVCG